jgi:hypothetical protein
MNADKSTPLVKRWMKENNLFPIIEKYNDGKTYLNRNGKVCQKVNLGCDFWVPLEGEKFTVEYKMEWSEKCSLNVKLHQLRRLRDYEGFMVCVKEYKDKTLDFVIKTWDDVSDETKNDLKIIEEHQKEGKLRCISVIEVRWK